MTRIGYIRVSSKDQNLDRQLEALKGVSKVFADKLSGSSTDRAELQAMLSYIRQGDIVVVTELDRLGRNSQELTQIMNKIQQKGATLEVLSLPSSRGIEDDNLRALLNNLILELYKYQAEEERRKIRERQAQGIALAKEKGRYHGRKSLFAADDPRLLHAFRLFKEGKSDREVEELTGIKTRTFRRYRLKYGINRKDK
ncbi:recombinase family protein [Streptococcus anginosus]|uniref:recombinase family protein n=1 Tax=Streptococcus anginosus TaxID=1328 RepID=UPI000391A018|nr:recombinase family protein [Streptococcus anginosus]MED5860203.1 recombinase family protein [Streptococcus anginosus]MED5873915.1 recombinase family protein [Streptococcus anginosus]GAD41582.1 hypothetical protein ANG4_0176 [Streptococcus anginosus 1505]